MIRVRSIWSGFPGAPGYTDLYFAGTVATPTDVDNHRTAVQAFWLAVVPNMPTDVSIAIEDEVALVDFATGDVTGYASGTLVLAPSVGTNAAAYAAPVGGIVQWNTGAVAAGRRVRGRTFLVPLTVENFDRAGSLTAAAVGTLAGAANALVANANTELVVFSRPTATRPGFFSSVAGAGVPDKAIILRSRRD